MKMFIKMGERDESETFVFDGAIVFGWMLRKLQYLKVNESRFSTRTPPEPTR
jgi:hypothetical protein